jgi:hypothetical protein
MTQGIKAFNTKLYIGDGASPEVFTKIDEVFNLGPVGGTKELVDFTNHDSVGFYEYQVFDLKDGKEIQAEANHIPANTSQGLIRTADANSSVDNYMIIGRDGNGFAFPAIITNLETDFSDLKGRVVFRFTLKIAGNVTPVTNYSPA